MAASSDFINTCRFCESLLLLISCQLLLLCRAQIALMSMPQIVVTLTVLCYDVLQIYFSFICLMMQHRQAKDRIAWLKASALDLFHTLLPLPALFLRLFFLWSLLLDRADNDGVGNRCKPASRGVGSNPGVGDHPEAPVWTWSDWYEEPGKQLLPQFCHASALHRPRLREHVSNFLFCLQCLKSQPYPRSILSIWCF